MTRPSNLDRLLTIMARLRDPRHGCPWDVEQSFVSIAPYTIEEAYEVADAIERGDMADLREELGDLLLQIAFHSRMAEEAGLFAFDDVAAAIADKMVERHPHVFGDAHRPDAAARTRAWEAQKAAERAAKADCERPAGALDGVTVALPALTRARKIQARAARVGFDWLAAAPVLDKIAEEIDELRVELAGDNHDRIEDELGDLLFAVTNLARKLDCDPEQALRRATAKFERRFRAMEARLRAAGRRMEDSDLDALEALWQAVKAGETLDDQV